MLHAVRDAYARSGHLRRVLASPWARLALVAVPVAVSVLGLTRVPRLDLIPLLPAVAAWTVGKYLLCPVRWYLVSRNGHGLWWHVRAYAEGELFGLASPAHVGADLWRTSRLVRAGMAGGHAAGVVAVDRLIGAVALVLTGVAVGVTLPAAVAVPALAVGAAAAVVAAYLRRRRSRPLRSWPGWRAAAAGLGLSLVYQVTAIALLLAAIVATGERVATAEVATVYSGSQVAGVVPGLNGFSAREGALVTALATTGVPWSAAFGAVALVALIAWFPALALGGSSLLVRWFHPAVAP